MPGATPQARAAGNQLLRRGKTGRAGARRRSLSQLADRNGTEGYVTSGLFQTELPQAPIEGSNRESERTRGLLLVAVVVLEGPRDQLALCLLDRRDRPRRRARLGGERGAERRQVRQRDLAVGAERVGALEDVLELTDVAGKVVRHQRGERVGRQPPHLAPEAFVEPPQEGQRERRDVLASRAKRRDDDPDHVDPIVEVLPEAPALHRRLEIPVRRG